MCGRQHDADQDDAHLEHVVSPRELAPGLWVAIDVEEDIEHARARFLTPAVLAAFEAGGSGRTTAPPE